MIDFAVDYFSFALRYGISWLTLGLAILALFKSRKLRKKFNRYLPPLFRDEQDSEVSKYIKNQERIESKLDALLEKEGIVWIGPIETLKNTEARSYRRLSLLLQMVTNQRSRRNQRMKFYLQKLGSRKFQAYLAVTIPNLIILFGFIFGNVDLEGRVNEWMPAINLGIQTIATLIYSQANVSAMKVKGVTTNESTEHINTSEFEG